MVTGSPILRWISVRLGDKTPGVQAADKASVANAAVDLN